MKPTYWACTECRSRCTLFKEDTLSPAYCAVDSDLSADWQEISRDVFLDHEKLLNDPAYNVPLGGKSTGKIFEEKEKLASSNSIEAPSYLTATENKQAIKDASDQLPEGLRRILSDNVPTFRVGDLVRINTNIVNYPWEAMKKKVDVIYKVTNIIPNWKLYYLDDGTPRRWSGDCLELVKKFRKKLDITGHCVYINIHTTVN